MTTSYNSTASFIPYEATLPSDLHRLYAELLIPRNAETDATLLRSCTAILSRSDVPGNLRRLTISRHGIKLYGMYKFGTASKTRAG